MSDIVTDDSSINDLFNNTSGLPRTLRGNMPYEVMALSPKEVWGHGHGSTTLECRQKWEDAATWIRYMVGEVKVVQTSQQSRVPTLLRYLPEPLRYNEIGGIPGQGGGTDKRVQWCTGLAQTDQGGTSYFHGAMSQAGTNWPKVDWCRYQTQFETTPYWVRSSAEMDAIAIAANSGPSAYAGARELYRYVDRQCTNTSKEQPIPAASTAGGFKVIDDVTAANRRPIGQVGFRVISMADVTYKWIRVPVGWPPPPGWLISDPANPWPPPANPSAPAPGVARRTRDTFKGKVNSDYFDCADIEGYCWQPGELLYTGYDDSYRYFDAAGDRVCDITFRFRFKEGGWNKFLSARGEWKEVSLTGLSTGTKPYESADFNDLFRWSAA